MTTIVEYTREDECGCGGVEGQLYADGSLKLRYGSVGDRAVYINAMVEIDTNAKKIMFTSMTYKFEDYDESGSGDARAYVWYKRNRCEVTAVIIEDFIADVYGADWTFDIHV